jgi:hypothetical protein
MSNFCSADEEKLLIQEIQHMMMTQGVNQIDERLAPIYQGQMAHIPNAPQVNMRRVTGRFERQPMGTAQWKYGDQFAPEGLPPMVRKIAERIQESKDFKLGPLRDVTMNYRHSSFFRLDPHVDPLGDGENVFILGLNSNAVLTLSPRGTYRRQDEVQIAKKSWTDADIDSLLPQRGLLMLCGPARNTWMHGMRQGVPVPPMKISWRDWLAGRDPSVGQPPLCDWWGRPDSIVHRNSVRYSVIFAFGHSEPQRFPSSWLGGNQY